MFKSSIIGSASSVSLPIFKSSAVASYGEIVGNPKITDEQLEEKILYFDLYSISCQEDWTTQDIFANVWVGILNFFGQLTDTKFDFPDYWFLIATTEKNSYYLIQKGEGGKSIAFFKSREEAKNNVKGKYYGKEITHMGEYTLYEFIDIIDVIEYVDSLSNSYNLIDDNCQVFIRNILKHFRFCDDKDDYYKKLGRHTVADEVHKMRLKRFENLGKRHFNKMLKNSSDELEKEIVKIFNKVKNAKNDNDIIDALNLKKIFKNDKELREYFLEFKKCLETDEVGESVCYYISMVLNYQRENETL